MITRHAIEHTLDFRYSAPVHSSVMTLYVQPLQDRRQVLLDFAIETDPDGPVFTFDGPFNNKGHFLDRPSPHERLVVRTRSTVETGPRRNLPDSLGSDGWERVKTGVCDPELGLMLQPSPFVRPSPALDQFIHTHDLQAGDDPLASARELSATLHRLFEYTPGSTAADSPIESILETGCGVCQDYAHVMAAIMRTWGIPCRYVSGYLGPDAAGAAPAASHAWVECWFPDLGWTGLDPTNDSGDDERHIRVAVGRDYGDVPPTRGVFKGSARSVLTPEVTVTRQET
ncbi:MAG: transglutaminase family protein [Gemmatimonadetes bacterium]|nr:transglutaminase family protein [Gemmatimonadota bacterium]MYB99723.1 transglutaminase family protein [Gemmatimonadota bacterium]MYI45983.1 transglutaminase family protein [Gemmatimonadota bacterium]